MRVSSGSPLPETFEETDDISTEFHSDSTHNSSELIDQLGATYVLHQINIYTMLHPLLQMVNSIHLQTLYLFHLVVSTHILIQVTIL